MMTTPSLPPNPFAPYAEPIGHLIHNFSILEGIVHWAIRVLLRLTQAETHIVVAQIQSFTARAYLLQSVGNLRIRDPAKNQTWNDIISEISRINTGRNNVLHYQWHGYILPAGLAQTGKATARQRLKFAWKEWSPSDINALSDDCLKAGVDLQTFLRTELRARGGVFSP